MSNSLKKVVLVDGLRTPFTKAGGEFRQTHPARLAAWNLKELLFRQASSEIELDEVIIGNVANLPDAANIARVIALQAGLPESVSAMTVHRNCASSLESLATGFSKIKANLLKQVCVGGVESMSQIPFFLSQELQAGIYQIFQSKTWSEKWKVLTQFRPSMLKIRSGLLEALTDPFTGMNMGETAELLAKEWQVSRAEQDEFAYYSHKKALEHEAKLQEEIMPVFVGDGFKMVTKDTGPRKNINKEKMSRMRAYFDKRYGTVTIANSCPINDGSSMLLIMEEDESKARGLKPLVRIRDLAFVGLDPRRMGLGPAYAIPKVLKSSGLSIKDIGLFEINEAFAAQVLACLRHLEKQSLTIDPSCLNVNGGAIALGHPVSATGARMILTLAKEMKRKQVPFGLASLCIGGGQGGACILELV